MSYGFINAEPCYGEQQDEIPTKLVIVFRTRTCVIDGGTKITCAMDEPNSVLVSCVLVSDTAADVKPGVGVIGS